MPDMPDDPPGQLKIAWTRLSRVVSHALRHEPWLYELELDAEGWAPVESLLAALRQERPEWSRLTPADLATMIEQASKRRYELQGNRVRAFYGHSLPGRLHRTPSAPPDVLYHGTSPLDLPAILSQGLCPMARQYVHLSRDLDTAREVGRRKALNPVLLTIDARRADEQGVRFYLGNEKVWLADSVPPEFLAPLAPAR